MINQILKNSNVFSHFSVCDLRLFLLACNVGVVIDFNAWMSKWQIGDDFLLFCKNSYVKTLKLEYSVCFITSSFLSKFVLLLENEIETF